VRIQPTGRDDLASAVDRARAKVLEQLDALNSEELQSSWDNASDAVTRIVAEGREVEAFRGKAIFNAFFDRFAKHAGLAKGLRLRGRGTGHECSRSARLVDGAVRRITNYVPSELVDAAADLQERHRDGENGDAVAALVQPIRAARVAWESGADLPSTPEALRDGCVQLARLAETLGEPIVAEQIRRETARVAARSATK
jgi:hypothetical protein